MVWLLCRLLYTLIIIKYQGFSDLPFHYALSCSFLLVIPFPPFNFRVPRFSHLSFIITPWVHREQSSQESIVPCWWDSTQTGSTFCWWSSRVFPPSAENGSALYSPSVSYFRFCFPDILLTWVFSLSRGDLYSRLFISTQSYWYKELVSITTTDCVLYE